VPTRSVAATPQALIDLARSFARRLRPGDIVTLRGPMGAGKTTFVRGLALELTGEDAVSSPTFTFWHRYGGARNLHHLDLYRIDDERELLDMGLEEAFGPDAIVVVEWPERAPSLVPPAAFDVTIEGAGDEPRQVRIEPLAAATGRPG
jgi:tRNA threonylcarbamoyladenosine biosynthesis protein TsaE